MFRMEDGRRIPQDSEESEKLEMQRGWVDRSIRIRINKNSGARYRLRSSRRTIGAASGERRAASGERGWGWVGVYVCA
jgi:hypothetical protein